MERVLGWESKSVRRGILTWIGCHLTKGFGTISGVMRLSDALVAVLAFVGAAIMTWWIRRRHQVEHYISSPVLVLLLVGIFGLFLWTINQVRDFYFGTPVPIVVVPPFILPSFPTTEPVVSLSTLPQELKEIIRKWLDDL